MKEAGTLKVKVNKAKLTRETDLLKNMDPYVVLEMNGIKAQTEVSVRAGKAADWNEVFFFPCNMNDELRFQVWDRDRLKSHDLVGKGLTKIDERYKNVEQSFWYELVYQGASAGEVAMDITFFLNDPYVIEKSEKLSISIKEKKKYLKELQAFLGMEVNRSVGPIEIKSQGDPVLEMLKLENETLRSKSSKLTERKNQMFFLMNNLKEEQMKTGAELEKVQSANKDRRDELTAAKTFKESGIILITCLQASFKKNADKTGKQDPFCILRMGAQCLNTPVHKDAGLNAAWNDTFKLARDMEETLEIIVMNENSIQKHSKLGYACLGLRPVIWSKKEQTRVLELVKNTDVVGELRFTIQFA